MSKKKSVTLLTILTLLLFSIGFNTGPITQPQSYHHFADQRSLFGLPNAWNTLSNIPFALVGIWGLYLLLSHNNAQFVNEQERWPWIGVSIGLILITIGSSYYHLEPDNSRLVWDRLAMTILFMSFAAALITERINLKLGLCLFPLLLFIGFYSVLYWYASDQHGLGDLRIYLGVQIFTAIVAFVMLITPSPYNRGKDIAVVLLFFGLTFLLEISDRQIYKLTNNWISGHTLKHIAGAFAGFWLIRMLWKRKIVHNLKKKDR